MKTPPPGYKEVSLSLSDEYPDWRGSCKLLLPIAALEQFEEYELEKDIARREVGNAKSLQEVTKAPTPAPSAFANSTNGGADRPRKPSYLRVDPHLELEKAQEEAEDQPCPVGAHRVYSTDAPARMLVNILIQTPAQEDHRRIEQLFTKLAKKGPFRPVAPPQAGVDSRLEHLLQLTQDHPHFASVIDLAVDKINLATSTGVPTRLPPVLLLGDPGIGKTHFARAFAKALDAPSSLLGLDGAFANGMLLGSDRRWSNSTYGKAFEAVCLGDCASPVIVLDEIDKAPKFHNGSPLDSLHSLLEPETAGQVTDASLDFQFDASFVTWIATANYEDRIPPTLLSRFRIFRIARPTGLKAIQATQAVLQSVVKHAWPGDCPVPDRRIAVELAHLTAREVYQAATDAVGKAIYEGRGNLLLSDFEPELLLSFDPNAPKRGLLH